MVQKHKTASQTNGSYIEFQAAVLLALPRDINSDVALGWTQNEKWLAQVLREALMPKGKVVGEYFLPVDYDLSVEEAVELGRYHWVDPDITTDNFPCKRKGKTKVMVELVRFTRKVLTDEALRELGNMGYRPAELHELLALGQMHPNVQRKFPVVALGSVWQNLGGCYDVPCLGRSGSKRALYLDWLELDWNETYRFLAVRK